MLGYQRIHKNNSILLRISFIIFIGIFLWGCKGPKETTKTIEARSDLKEFLTKYEKTFDPSEYDMKVDSILAEEKRRHDAIELGKYITVAQPETIPGFRVQVLFTPDIEQANRTRDSLMNLIPYDWTYIIYDVPYYKVRVGNYPERMNANQMVKRLISLGYQDAWIVPDKIIKNPTPRLPNIEITPEKQPEQKR